MPNYPFNNMQRRFVVHCVRSLRQYLLSAGLIHLHATFTDDDCDVWENAQLMGCEL